MEIQPIQILLQIINFGLVLFLLMKFLVKPIAKVLEQRSEKIKLGLDAAEANLADRKKSETQIKADITKARKEAAVIISEAKKQAEVEAGDIIAKAKEQAKKAAVSEKQAFDSMLHEAEKKAESRMKELVTAITAKVLTDGLTKEQQQKIIDAQIKRINIKEFAN
jgi:F-type H+-transporting ATPase subunit b